MLTFVGVPKAFTGPFSTVQRNALGSWSRLDPEGELMLFGDDPGVAELAREVGARHVPQVTTSDSGVPLLSSILDEARERAANEWLVYANADIILTPALVEAVRRVAAWRRRFLLTGRRTNLRLEAPLTFAEGWEEALAQEASERGQLHPGTDYFVFPRNLWGEVPPFVIGRESWSCWLLMAARQRRAVVVDASEVVLAVHQEHPYASGLWKSPEWAANERLLGGKRNQFLAPEATHALSERGLRRRCRNGYPVCACAFEEP